MAPASRHLPFGYRRSISTRRVPLSARMYDRWFDVLETRLTLLADELFELARASAEREAIRPS